MLGRLIPLIELLVRLAGFVMAFRWGKKDEKQKQDSRDAEAISDKLDVIDRVHRLSDADRRRLLNDWTRPVSRLESDRADER